MYVFEGYCRGGTVQVQPDGAETVQAAADAFASAWDAQCDGDSLPNPITWTGDGTSNFAETNVPFGWAIDTTGNSWPAGQQSVTWVAASNDQQYPGFTASEIATVFSWGFGAVVFFWFLGQCIGAVLGVIRRA